MAAMGPTVPTPSPHASRVAGRAGGAERTKMKPYWTMEGVCAAWTGVSGSVCSVDRGEWECVQRGQG